MTRNTVSRTLRRLYWTLGFVLFFLLGAKFADDVPGVPAVIVNIAGQVYEFMRDMSLLIATGGVAYLSNIFQKRSTFVGSLEEEWRSIVRTKSALLTFCEKPYRGTDDYLAAFSRISETIDTMRIVYRNAGETDALVGLYPYAPLHDMRRAIQLLDPRVNPDATQEEKALVKDAILQSFYALREVFLEELDLEDPQHTLLVSGARRLKTPGATRRALSEQEHQRRRLDRDGGGRVDIAEMLAAWREREKAAGRDTPKQ